MRTTLAACLLACTAAEAARQPLPRRQASQQQGVSSRATPSTHSLPSATSQAALDYPKYSYSPGTSSIPASPASVPSRSAPSSTLSYSYSWASSYAQQTGAAYSTGFPSNGYAPGTVASPVLVASDDCGGVTVNVRNASLDWWWDHYTIWDPIYTIKYLSDNSSSVTAWTILSQTTTTDPLDLSTLDCMDEPATATITFTDATFTMMGQSCSEVAQIVAPATTAITLTGFKTPEVFSGDGYMVPHFWKMPGVPTSVIANTTFGTQAPFVYFTQYEVESSNFTSRTRGLGVCNTITQTYTLDEPYAFTYTGESPEDATPYVTSVVDNLDPDFPAAIGQPNVTAGAFSAVPTVIYIVEEIFAASIQNYAAAKTMMTAPRLDVPTATLPDGVSATADDDGHDLYTSLVALATAHTETSDLVLIIPGPATTTEPPAFHVQSLIDGNIEDTTTTDIATLIPPLLGGIILHGLGDTTTTTDTGIVAGGATLQRVPTQVVVVDGQTATAGGSAITVSGTPILVPKKGNVIVVGDSTVDIPTSGVTNVAGVEISEMPQTLLTGGGQTLAPGHAITISGTPVSLVPGGGALVIGTSTTLLETRLLTLGSQTFTADASSRFVIAGTTLAPGGSAVISGTTLMLEPGATAVVVNGQTSQIKPTVAPGPATTPRPALTIDGQIIIPSSNSYWVISGQTLWPGGAVTFNNYNYQAETVSLDAAGSTLVNIVAGKTTTAKLSSATLPVIVVGGHTYAAQAGSGSTYVIEGHTLTNGGSQTVTVGGTIYVLSLAATPTAVSIQLEGGSSSTVEMLWTASATSMSSGTTSTSPPTSSTTPATLSGRAASMTVQILSLVVGGGALALAVWL